MFKNILIVVCSVSALIVFVVIALPFLIVKNLESNPPIADSPALLLGDESDTDISPPDEMAASDSSTTITSKSAQDEPTISTTTTATSAGKYLPFSPGALAAASNTRRVLFFYANWCPTCQPVDQELSTQTSQLPADVTVLRVNYNDTETDEDEKALAKQYGITYQHTFVQLDAQGAAVTRWNGGGVEELLERFK